MQHKTPSYDVRVEEVWSGDDMVVMVDLGIDGLYKRVRVRLYGVDTPNAHHQKSETEATFVRDWVRSQTMPSMNTRGEVESPRCHIQVWQQGKGGWLVTLFKQEATDKPLVNINQVLMEKGYVFDLNKRQREPGREVREQVTDPQ